MKKIYHIFLFLNVFVFGQLSSDNRFSQSEHSNDGFAKKTDNTKKDVYGKPGNPGGSVPIDQYAAFLLLAGFGAIILISKKSSTIK